MLVRNEVRLEADTIGGGSRSRHLTRIRYPFQRTGHGARTRITVDESKQRELRSFSALQCLCCSALQCIYVVSELTAMKLMQCLGGNCLWGDLGRNPSVHEGGEDHQGQGKEGGLELRNSVR